MHMGLRRRPEVHGKGSGEKPGLVRNHCFNQSHAGGTITKTLPVSNLRAALIPRVPNLSPNRQRLASEVQASQPTKALAHACRRCLARSTETRDEEQPMPPRL